MDLYKSTCTSLAGKKSQGQIHGKVDRGEFIDLGFHFISVKMSGKLTLLKLPQRLFGNSLTVFYLRVAH